MEGSVHAWPSDREPGASLALVEVWRVKDFQQMRGKQYNLHELRWPITGLEKWHDRDRHRQQGEKWHYDSLYTSYRGCKNTYYPYL